MHPRVSLSPIDAISAMVAPADALGYETRRTDELG
jgi:hypothetical protein